MPSSNHRPDMDMLQRMIDTIDLGVFTFDKDRRVLFANDVAKRIFLSPSSEGKMGAADPEHFDKNEYYDEEGNLLVYPKGSAVDRALHGEETHDLFLEHRNRETHTNRWISVSCVPIKDKAGNFEYGILWCRDISTRKSREDKLKFLIASTRILSLTIGFEKRLEEKAKLFVPSLADWAAVDLVNPDGTLKRIALVHRDPEKLAWVRDYQKRHDSGSAVEMTAQRVTRTNTAEFLPRITDEMIDNTPDLTPKQREEVRALHLSSVMVVPISVKGKVLGVLTVAYAESGRIYTHTDFEFVKEFANHLSTLLENARLYTQLSERDRSRDAFLASLSHELRNPLAPIRTGLELLRLKNPSGAFREEIDSIAHQFAHLTRLLNDLLDSTRFTQGKINIVPEPTDLIHVIEQVSRSVRPLLEESAIRLHLSYPAKQVVISADRTRLGQALMNILSNAVKFTPHNGSIWFELKDEGDIIKIEVRDSGAGMTNDELPHIFDPYYQSDRVQPGNSGLGIGLFLVQQIIRLHGGTVKATSEGLDKGSTFTITLPNTAPDGRYHAPGSLPRAIESGIKEILIVDDNHAAADMLSRLLVALGWHATGVYSAESTLAYLDTHHVDMIFLDIGMPDMSGYELVKLLRKRPDCKDTPIIAVTGYGMEEDKKKAKDAGFSAHITKPIGVQELRAILTKG